MSSSRVTVGSALPTGTNSIGQVTANAGTNLNTSALATSAKQPALGTAGTASADVISVQGVASMTPVTQGLKQTRISVTPTVSTTPAYTAKDAVGGLLTFSNAARVSGGTITIQSVVVIDNSQQRPPLDLVLFDRTFTNSSDNAIFAPSDSDLLNTIGVVSVAAWSDFSTNSVATRFGLGMAAKLNGTDLFGQLVTSGAVTFVATNDITVILQIVQD